MKSNNVTMLSYAARPVGRFMPANGAEITYFEHEILIDLVIQAVKEAGLDKKDIGSLILTSPSPATEQLGFATFLCSKLGLSFDGQIADVNNMGITGGLAFDMACRDTMQMKDKASLVLGIEYSTAVAAEVIMERSVRVVGDIDYQSPFGLTPIAWYALDANRYMYETGVSREDIAYIAVKNRQHAMLNPLAQFRKSLDIQDVLNQRPIVEPLGLFEVPPISDGAICMVVANEDMARDSGRPHIRVTGRGFHSDGFHQIGDRPHDITAFPAATRASSNAMSVAGIGITDLDVAELYAPCTITEILVTEAIGIAEKGRGAYLAKDGETSLGGRLPVSTSGGCLSRGHPPSLTALYGLAELFDQLTLTAGDRQVQGAECAMHICELGNYNSALAHIVEAAG